MYKYMLIGGGAAGLYYTDDCAPPRPFIQVPDYQEERIDLTTINDPHDERIMMVSFSIYHYTDIELGVRLSGDQKGVTLHLYVHESLSHVEALLQLIEHYQPRKEFIPHD